MLIGGCAEDPVRIPVVAGGDATGCADLVAALPESVADLEPRALEPADAPGAAWGDPPVVLTCGGPVPAGFDETSTCTTVNDVDWFIPEQAEATEPVDLTMTTVYRSPVVEVRLPREHWPPATTLADLSEAVNAHTLASDRCR